MQYVVDIRQGSIRHAVSGILAVAPLSPPSSPTITDGKLPWVLKLWRKKKCFKQCCNTNKWTMFMFINHCKLHVKQISATYDITVEFITKGCWCRRGFDRYDHIWWIINPQNEKHTFDRENFSKMQTLSACLECWRKYISGKSLLKVSNWWLLFQHLTVRFWPHPPTTTTTTRKKRSLKIWFGSAVKGHWKYY